MGVISEEMLRRRAEHNEGVLHSLEELVLQEEGIMEINKVLGSLCPQLKILYLPNNLIGQLGNLHRLKQLQYLNLAVNNIQKIEGLGQCEALEKLDLTLNFVDRKGLPSVASLRANVHLQDLFLTGNPCQDVPGYRNFVIGTLPSLKRLDGIEIRPTERIIAQQNSHLLKEMISNGDDTKIEERPTEDMNENGQIIRDYTPASRLAEYAELEEMKAKGKNGKADNEQKPSQRRKGFDPLPSEGRIYQKNEGGWSFKLTESDCGGKLILDVAVGRYMDTSAIDVDIQPLLVRALIKGKLLQLRLPEEVKTDASAAQRSATSGHLVVTMPKAVVNRRKVLKGNMYPASYVLEPNKSREKMSQHKSPCSKITFSDIENIVDQPNKVGGIVQMQQHQHSESQDKLNKPKSVAADIPSSESQGESDDVPPLE